MKTAELEGAALDAAVALAEGFASFWIDPGDESRGESCVLGPARAEDSRFDWCPSSAWEQGGPILEREQILVRGDVPIEWDEATHKHGGTGFQALIKPYINYDGLFDGEFKATGRTYLVAAMRAFVHAKIGPEVTLP